MEVTLLYVVILMALRREVNREFKLRVYTSNGKRLSKKKITVSGNKE
jgi:hypothetical protein